MPQPSWMIYGANGYTGRLIAEAAADAGHTPVLAGRRVEAVRPLGERLGCPWRVFSLDRAGPIADALRGIHTVLHCAGPFSKTAHPMIDGCLAAKANYLDITGEIDVIEMAAGLGETAAAAGVSLIPAVGFDVVPTDCLAAMLAERLPGATRLQLAFSGLFRMSPGTARTVLEGLAGGARVRIGGQITRVPLSWKTTKIRFRDTTRTAITIAWGDVASAYYSTGIPNIEVYSAVSPGQIQALRVLDWAAPLLKVGLLRRLLGRAVRRWTSGPTAADRQEGRASLWGRASDSDGSAVEATLETPEGYRLTVMTALRSAERVLDGGVEPGFATPSRAFGAKFIIEFPETDLKWRD